MNKAGRTRALYPKFLLPVAGLLRSCSGWERVKNGVWQGEQSRPLLQLSVPCLGPHGLQPALQGHCFLLFLLFQVLLPGWEQMGGQDTAQGRRFLHRHSGRSFPLLHLWPHTGVSLSMWRPPDDSKGQWELSNRVSRREKRHQTGSRQLEGIAKFTIQLGRPRWHRPVHGVLVEGTPGPGLTWDQLNSA